MNTTEEFKRLGYAVIQNLIDATEAARLYQYTLQNMSRGNLKDGQVLGSPSFYQDKEMVILQQKVLPRIEELTQIKLFSTFCYYRTYRLGAILKSHKDRKACEISVSMNLGQQGDLWDLWFIDYEENARNVRLAPGDAVIYRGCDLTHGRGKLLNADYVSQVFFHFVAQKGRKAFTQKTELWTRFTAKCKRMLRMEY